jgi:hypothetical protein
MALLFRDKVKMKRLFEEAGLTPVPYRSIQSPPPSLKPSPTSARWW